MGILTRPVLTGHVAFPGMRLADFVKMINDTLAARRGVKVKPPIPENFAEDAPTVQPYINHNRWVIDCPSCRGAEYWWPGEPLFMCFSCWNTEFGGMWLHVRQPSKERRQMMEATVMVRALDDNRSIRLNEKIEDAQKLNIEHGLPAHAGLA